MEYDITPQKVRNSYNGLAWREIAINKVLQAAITDLIMLRFDKFQREQEPSTLSAAALEPAPTTNGAHQAPKREPSESASPAKRRAESEEMSDVVDSPPPKKAKKSRPTTATGAAETDEELAKRMQAELNAPSARSTRGGGTKKKAVAKKKEKTPKKKSKAKVGSDVDSDVDGEEKPEKEKKGGFHVCLPTTPCPAPLLLTIAMQKPMLLSEPLAAMLGESALSRPQTVKKIWAYVRERDLQDPNDKRQIRCDDVMRAVFKQDKVHMFTMNKLLASNLYPMDE